MVHRITLVILLVTVVVMGLGFNFVIYKDTQNARQNMLETAETTAITVAGYAASDLIFNDRTAGRETLSGLKAVPSTLNAFLYDEKGKPFASLHKTDSFPIISETDKGIPKFHGSRLYVTKPVRHQGVNYGSLFIEFSTRKMDEQIQQYRLLTIYTAVGLLFISYLLAIALSRLISKPILKLSQASKEISKNMDYKLRVSTSSQDEVGDLYDAFNEMLIRIQQHDAEQKNAEQALKNSKDRLNQFFRAAYEGIFFHEQGNILDVNPGIVNITGYKPEEVIGHNLLEFLAPEVRKEVAEGMQDRERAPFETQLIHKNGHVVPVEARVGTMTDNDTRIVAIQDITARKEAQKALQQAYDVLEEKVTERTADLQAANIKLKELDRLKSMFIASISHELRTPLNSIIGFSSMMKRGIYGELGDKYTDYIIRINNAGQHLLALITDIIDISKIESGRIDLVLSEFKIDDMVNEAVENIRREAESKGLSINVTLPDHIFMHSDKRRVFQCLLNFLSNAMKYSEQGNIDLTVEQQDEDIIFTIKDTGIGIDEEDMPRLFEAFERMESHLQVKAGGTGLGLYLTRKIVEEILQGKVGAQSSKGVGSQFWIRVPRSLPDLR